MERTVYKTKLGNDLFEEIIKRKNIFFLSLRGNVLRTFEIRVIFWTVKMPRTFAIFRSCLLFTENEIIHSSWRQKYRLLVWLSISILAFSDREKLLLTLHEIIYVIGSYWWPHWRLRYMWCLTISKFEGIGSGIINYLYWSKFIEIVKNHTLVGFCGMPNLGIVRLPAPIVSGELLTK